MHPATPLNNEEVQLDDNQRARITQMILSAPKYTGPELAELAGLDFERARGLWRAMGMPEVREEERVFTDEDLEALNILSALLSGGYPPEDLITLTRLVGRAMSRITDATTRTFVERVGVEGQEIPEDSVATMVGAAGHLFEYVYRRHLSAAIHGFDVGVDESPLGLAVGFADLVSFSRISDDLSEEELGAIIARFEDVAMSTCVDSHVRLVKIVGDSAMFVSPDASVALEGARALVANVAMDGSLPAARAGLDFGPVLPRGGDYFGRPVNVASRIAAFAREGSVVFSGSFLDALPEGFGDVTRLRPRRLHNVGRVPLYRLGKSER